MFLPTLTNQRMTRETSTIFGGYNHNDKISDGRTVNSKTYPVEFYEMENMSSRAYPLLATRELRGTYATATAPNGIIAKDAIAYVDGANLIYNGSTISMNLSTAANMVPKQLVSMGAYLLIWPDKKYLNTQSLTDYGSMENTYTADASVVTSVSLCNLSGTVYSTYTAAGTAPTDPTNGQMWLDTSGESPVLKEYSTDSGSWVSVATTYLKISSAGINTGFSQYDGVTISGFTGTLATLNGDYVIYGVGSGYIIVIGTLTGQSVTQTGGVTVSRTVPDMDFVTECENRIWGCKYGMVNGEAVNEIYASKLGDFKNWRCFMGLSTDSYSASRGSDGVFTGAITHLGYPLFFKENCIEKVYPASNGAHQIVTTVARGVQRGCWRSLQIVGETLFYKSLKGICAYTGSLPSSVSDALGDVDYHDARAGATNDRYYISMADSSNTYHLFVLDTVNGIWCREDNTKATMFARCDGDLYWIDETTKKIMCANAQAVVAANREESFSWSVESGWIGRDRPDRSYISQIAVNMDFDNTKNVSGSVSVDGGQWRTFRIAPGQRGNTTAHIRPHRCKRFKFGISGSGYFEAFSLTKFIQRGGDGVV